MLPVDGGFLVNNIGLFRIFENLAEGWKPVMIESNLREVGVREEDFMRPERQQLAIAEPMMFNVSNETFVDLRFAHDLYRAEPAGRGGMEGDRPSTTASLPNMQNTIAARSPWPRWPWCWTTAARARP